MPIWGRLLGLIFGMMFLKIPGAILGFFVGYMFDKGYSQDFGRMGGFGRFFSSQDALQQQAIFFHSLFAALGHLAKSDGKVTESEIKVASRLMDDMQLQGQARQEAQQAFREGKSRDFPIADILKQLYESCHGRRDILQVFLEILIQAAFADGRLANEEYRVLEKVAKALGFVRRDLDYLIAMFEAEVRFRSQGRGSHQRQGTQQSSGPSLEDAYAVLGVTASDDEKAIKRAYRKRMSEHHPDKLASKGLPEQAMEIAKSKAQDIQAAYELIKERRGFK